MTTYAQDSAATDKLMQYLNEAHATEHALTRTLEAHIAITPSGLVSLRPREAPDRDPQPR